MTNFMETLQIDYRVIFNISDTHHSSSSSSSSHGVPSLLVDDFKFKSKPVSTDSTKATLCELTGSEAVAADSQKHFGHWAQASGMQMSLLGACDDSHWQWLSEVTHYPKLSCSQVQQIE